MERFRVLVVVHELSRTGAPIAALRLFRELADRAQTTVVSPIDGPLRSDFEGFARVLVAPLWIGTGARLQRVRRGWQRAFPDPVRRTLPALPTDLVVVNSLASLRFVEELRLPAAPRVLAVHELGSLAEEVAGPRLAGARSSFDVAVANSSATGRWLVESAGWEGSKVRVVHPAGPEPVPDARLGEGFVVAGCGRWEPNKGGALWAMAMRRVADAIPGARFLWFGLDSDSERRRADLVFRQLGLTGRVEALGTVGDPRPLFARLHAFACASWEESFSLATLEAMAHGAVPVVVAGQGGSPEIVGEAGVVVDRFDPEPLADALVALARDAPRRRALSELARSRALSAFSPRAQAQAWWEAVGLGPRQG